ncbi:aminopeptidase 2 [Fusarium longipes]|uniref:Aminopeptidase 2 n=1 Tax=Fusarium longipes TaxID=694270 RepID=A0A395T1Z1_9HYPO|nr:aminopeptidase 2 [Fusarium longipes]
MDDDVKHRIAATAMESTYAREIFHCFDEPSIKAEFTLSIVVDESFVTVSNLLVKRSEALTSSKKLVTFQRSILMSTYRIAETIFHEISHVWFGNLVTMRYWDRLWLKDGFATLMSWYAADKMYPSWHFWDSYVANTLQSVYKFHGPELNDALRKLTLDVIGPTAKELGWTISKDDNESLIAFKTSMFSGTGLAGDPSVVSAAKELFAKRVAGNENAIPGSLRWEVFGIVVAQGDLEELQSLVDLWKNLSIEDEQYLAFECLGRAPNAELMKWVLGHLLTDTVKNHDMIRLTWLAGGTAHGAIELWEWTKQHWDRVEKQVPVDISSLFLGTALAGLQTKEQIQDVRDFFASRDTKSYQMVLDQNLEGMESRRCWAERDISNVWPDLREAHDAVCNKGIPRADLAAKFPHLDFSGCPESWDFAPHTPDDATVRAERVRRRVSEIAEAGKYKDIVLVTHRGFAAFMVQGERFSVCEYRSYRFADADEVGDDKRFGVNVDTCLKQDFGPTLLMPLVEG